MSQPESQYTTKKARTLQSLKAAATKTTAKAKMGSLFQPLLEIPLERIIIDELHLFLRIFDVPLRNLIYMVLKVDQDEGAQTHTDSLKKAIKECGVSFSLYENKDGRDTTYDWTSLVGRDKKRLLKVSYYMTVFNLTDYASSHVAVAQQDDNLPTQKCTCSTTSSQIMDGNWPYVHV